MWRHDKAVMVPKVKVLRRAKQYIGSSAYSKKVDIGWTLSIALDGNSTNSYYRMLYISNV